MDTRLSKFFDFKPTGAQQKKYALIESALKIITEKGLTDLTIAELARSTGMSKQLIIYHYKCVDDILTELFYLAGKQGQAYTVEALKDKSILEDQIAGIIEGAFNWVLAYPPIGTFFIVMYYQATLSKKFFSIHKSILDTGLSRIYEFLRHSKNYKKGDNKSLEMAAFSVHNLIIGTLTRMICLNDYDNYDYYLRSLKCAVEQMLKITLPEIKIKVNK